MQAKTIKGKSTEEIQSGLEQCITDDFTLTQAIAFLSVKQDRGGMAILLPDLNTAYFNVEIVEIRNSSTYATAKQFAVDRKIKNKIIHSIKNQ